MSDLGYKVILGQDTFKRIETYQAEIRAGVKSGNNLASHIVGQDVSNLDTSKLLNALLNSKKPQIFAESAVMGNGSDWTLRELGILGDISIGMTVSIFDNGAHQNPTVHKTPFVGHLIYTAGALLRNDLEATPADWRSVTVKGEFNRDKYYDLYERRLLPAFKYINKCAIERGRPAFISIPGIGCGQFAGPFHGQMGSLFQAVLVRFLDFHGDRFHAVKAVYYDPYNESVNFNRKINGVEFIVRPLIDNLGKSQLCQPVVLGEDSDGDYEDCELYSFVAWDHVSWPGNDYYLGSRFTDDGVKAAATNTMQIMTGIEGQYCADKKMYSPPSSYRNWYEVVTRNNLKIVSENNCFIV